MGKPNNKTGKAGLNVVFTCCVNINTNTGLPSNNNFNSELYYNIFQEFGLTHKMHAPTHKNGNTLDFILTTFPDKFNKVYSEVSSIESDHLMVNFTLNIKHKFPNALEENPC